MKRSTFSEMSDLVFRPFPKIGKWQDALNNGNELFLHTNAAKAKRQPLTVDPATGLPVQMRLPPETRLFSAKFKLHGTNAGIQTDGKGNFVTQSRNRLLSTESKSSDNSGFCAWVNKHLSKGWDQITNHVVLFGEFVGPGIFDDACGRLPERMLFIFAVLDVEKDVYHFVPSDIEGFVKPIIAANPGAEKILHVLPEVSVSSVGIVFSENFFFDIDPATANDKHPKPHPHIYADWEAKTAKIMNEIVLPMEKQDPYIMNKFGVNGPGEGIVMYANTWDGREYRTLMFKMKTPHHLEETPVEKVAQLKAVAKDPCVVFAKRFVAPARCEKVCAAATEHDPENMNLFIDALVNDVRTETVKELEDKGGWSAAYEAAVRQAASDWWARVRTASARTRKDLNNAAENKQAKDLVANNEATLTQLADVELQTTEPTVEEFAKVASVRLVPDEKNEQLRKKVSKQAKTWWLMRDKKTVQ